jgi:hypothetical protein
MNSRWTTVALIAGLIATFILGYRLSDRSGIQPGYFEKAEAPAYGVGGGEAIGAGLDEEFQDHFKDLYESMDD